MIPIKDKHKIFFLLFGVTSRRQFGILALLKRIHYRIREGVLKQSFQFSGHVMLLLCKETLLFRD